MYTSVQVTFCNTKKNILAKICIESPSNRFYFIEEQTLLKEIVSCFVCICCDDSILVAFTYLSSTCVELALISSRITMIFTFAILVKVLEVFLIHT